MTDQTKQAIAQWLSNYLSELLRIDIAQVDTALTFDDYGIDSRDALGMIGELGDWLGLDLDSSIIYDHQSIDELSNHLSLIKSEPS